MSHIRIPHTLKRRGIYHFNLRSGRSFVRLSLRTKCAHTALRIVSDVLDKVSSKGAASNMDKGELDSLVRNTVNTHLNRVGACFGEKSSYENSLFKAYQHRRLQQQFNSDFNNDARVETFSRFKLNRSFPKDSVENIVSNCIRKLFLDEEESINADAVDFDRNLFDAEEKLELFFRKIKRMERLILDDNYSEAKAIYDQLKVNVENNITCREVADKFIEAGIKGLLHPSRGNRGKPWTKKVMLDYKRTVELFVAYLGEINMSEISASNLDSFFTDIISNLPLGNIKPYNTMSAVELVDAIAGGSIEDGEVLANKSITHHLKRMKTMFTYYEKCLGGNSEAVENMRFYVEGEENVRGAFSKKQVAKIMDFVNGLNDGKKWPIKIMAFTGMRNNEAMQLRKEDIKESDDGIYFFNITPEAGKLKTAQSERRVPIHESLIEDGFLNFVDQSKDGYLFKRYSKSNKFLTRVYANSIRPECEIPSINDMGEKLSLYSLRHFVVTSLVEAGVVIGYIQKIVGHMVSEDKSVTTTNYTHLNSLKKMQEGINKISII
ncbi:MAG: tyrosine-type recombinase/integrase [Gammaproteobacteria bacterium]|nr:tyrosine-type recombinase/integrase [Gammaproteobacteria bacterium]